MTDSIIDKIRKLLAATTQNGCTESEAMSAAAIAARLMDKYNIDEAAVLAGQNEATDAMFDRANGFHPIGFVGKAVGLFTGCRIYRHTAKDQVEQKDLFGGSSWETIEVCKLRIVGLAHEVEIAKYVLDICWIAMEAASGKALQEENDERARGREPLIVGKERMRWVEDFQKGMALSMSKTLNDMTAERQRDMAKVVHIKGSGRDLVAVRSDLIAKWLSDRGISLTSGKGSSVKHKSAYGVGQAAGGNVRFHSGVGSGQRTQHAIGGK